MKKRASKRISVRLDGTFISSNTHCMAYIRNVSDLGVNAIVSPIRCQGDFEKETDHELKVNVPSGETITLHCMRKWSASISPQGVTKEVGLEIIDPPAEYKKFLTTLQ